ncbi:amidase family protein [Nonomuraea sp. NPDC049714]|uniref:amidase family protein n=1 Tax=Nonomuraea sp. NPDC049714 TaxID=3364357 RepID=UPI0037927711
MPCAATTSQRELTEHYLDRIAELDGELGAFVTVDPELALREADRADEQLARNEHTPLGGIPVGIKDLHATAGLATSYGSAPLAGHVPTEDGLIRRAGAVVLGKTNAPEFGVACYIPPGGPRERRGRADPLGRTPETPRRESDREPLILNGSRPAPVHRVMASRVWSGSRCCPL